MHINFTGKKVLNQQLKTQKETSNDRSLKTIRMVRLQ